MNLNVEQLVRILGYIDSAVVVAQEEIDKWDNPNLEDPEVRGAVYNKLTEEGFVGDILDTIIDATS